MRLGELALVWAGPTFPVLFPPFSVGMTKGVETHFPTVKS